MKPWFLGPFNAIPLVLRVVSMLAAMKISFS